MEVAIRLVRREATLSADAFLLLADDPAALAAACARLGGELPQVFAVRGGFLLVPRTAESRPVPGTVRLRRLSSDFFVPADGDLLPALLTDEMAALTRSHGLIVLPGGTLLAFDATAPLSVSRWLAPSKVRRAEWEPFPRRPERAEALTVIERPAPPVVAIIEVLGDGAPDGAAPMPGPGEGAGEGNPNDLRPAESGSPIMRAAAGVGLAAAGFLAWLGKQLGAEGLARMGGDLARRMLEYVPRLSDRVLGEQEAALRDVLRELQTGDVEKGLRYAPPAFADPDRPARVGTDARLSTRDPRYSLRDLIGTGGGVATAWLGGGDVWAELAREYRRLAAEAAARGDHRRAAYLYGVLLRDLRSAANALMAGGLYRDAALLFRDRLKDPLAAADAFDRAGDHDEALRLYDRLAEYERAGDLLRRLGEDDRAAAYYRRAAAVLAGGNHFLAAGDLLRTKAHLRNEAGRYYLRGWHTGTVEALTCAERLLDEARAARDQDAVEELWFDAEAILANRPRDASRFFNYVLRITDFLPEESRADLRDRARMHFATHLRTHARIGEAGSLVGELFPVGTTWPAPVGRDATFAVRSRHREPVPELRHSVGEEPVRIAGGLVTAVVAVRGTFDLIVASTEGVVYWHVAEKRVVPVWESRERVAALSASARGELVFAVARGADEKWRLRAFAADRVGTFRATTQYTLPTEGADDPAIFLQPAAVFRGGEHRVAVATPLDHLNFAGPYLQQEPRELLIEGCPVHLLVDTNDGHTWYWAGGFVSYRRTGEVPTVPGWHLSCKPTARVDWLTPASGILELATVDDSRSIHWSEYDTRFPTGPHERAAFASHPKGYAAVCLIAPRVLAAVTTDNQICWLRASAGEMTTTATRKLDLPARVVALAARPDANEVIAVLADGHAVRIHRA